MNATDCYGLTEIGRCDIDGVEYVAYEDGQYSYAVLASEYDDVHDEPQDDAEWRADAYDEWCTRTSCVDRATSAAVASELSLDGIYSTDGTCVWVPAADVIAEGMAYSSIKIYWDSQDMENEGWAWQATDKSGNHSSGEVDVLCPLRTTLDDAIEQACWQLGVKLLPHDFAREPNVEGGFARWDNG